MRHGAWRSQPGQAALRRRDTRALHLGDDPLGAVKIQVFLVIKARAESRRNP